MQTRLLMILGMVFGIFLLFQTPGCSKVASKSPPPPPPGTGEAIYRIKATEKTFIALERGTRRAEVPLPPEYKLYDLDVIENKGSKPAIISELQNNHKFTLAPESKVKVGYNSLVMYFGKTLFEFEKVNGEFRIVLPRAVLGIRGTRFEVEVQANGNSSVQLFEGKIAIEQDGKTTMLENQGTVNIDNASTPLQIIPASGTQTENIGSDSEDIQRNRTTTY